MQIATLPGIPELDELDELEVELELELELVEELLDDELDELELLVLVEVDEELVPPGPYGELLKSSSGLVGAEHEASAIAEYKSAAPPASASLAPRFAEPNWDDCF